MNKIQNAFDKMEKQITQRIEDGLTTSEKVEETCHDLDMDLDEYVKFQELKSLAVASSVLALEEGQLIYAKLGESIGTFNNQPVHVKAVLTGIFRELLEARLSQLQPARN